ncbi:hypothetical protein NLJ89_g9622 [Agrocybe chaxingu]|uniref:Uncharacterized protein n=1 Tax=Agrocybe chaxingu TaxID=84603 RepID=A0A9W8MSX5_9AGAR|nr:hypothetical protein NLJ89_g9622 [Agrocybe chaxingu]
MDNDGVGGRIAPQQDFSLMPVNHPPHVNPISKCFALVSALTPPAEPPPSTLGSATRARPLIGPRMSGPRGFERRRKAPGHRPRRPPSQPEAFSFLRHVFPDALHDDDGGISGRTMSYGYTWSLSTAPLGFVVCVVLDSGGRCRTSCIVATKGCRDGEKRREVMKGGGLSSTFGGELRRDNEGRSSPSPRPSPSSPSTPFLAAVIQDHRRISCLEDFRRRSQAFWEMGGTYLS